MRSIVEISDAGKIEAIQTILKRMDMTESEFFSQATDLFIEDCMAEWRADQEDGHEALRRLQSGEPTVSWVEAKKTLDPDLPTQENRTESMQIKQAIANIKHFREQYGTFSTTQIQNMLHEGRT